MDFDPKSLKKLADACRKAGITTFKGFGMEFTLAPQTQPKVVKRASKQTQADQQTPALITVPGPNGPVQLAVPGTISPDEIPTDSPTREELLYWSVSEEEAGGA